MSSWSKSSNNNCRPTPQRPSSPNPRSAGPKSSSSSAGPKNRSKSCAPRPRSRASRAATTRAPPAQSKPQPARLPATPKPPPAVGRDTMRRLVRRPARLVRAAPSGPPARLRPPPSHPPCMPHKPPPPTDGAAANRRSRCKQTAPPLVHRPRLVQLSLAPARWASRAREVGEALLGPAQGPAHLGGGGVGLVLGARHGDGPVDGEGQRRLRRPSHGELDHDKDRRVAQSLRARPAASPALARLAVPSRLAARRRLIIPAARRLPL